MHNVNQSTFEKAHRLLCRLLFVATLAATPAACRAQNASGQSQSPDTPVTQIPEEVQRNPAAPCLQPPPLVSWQDYQGPMAKVVGAFGRKVERKSVHPPHYKPGEILCT